jgi:uncharacterized membrane protein YwaF
MTTSEVPPGGKREARSDRKGWLDPGTWAGIFSIATSLLTGAMIALVTPEVWALGTLQRDWANRMFLTTCCGGLGVFLGAAAAVLGIVAARKERSARGFWLSVAGLILAVVLCLACWPVWTMFS